MTGDTKILLVDDEKKLLEVFAGMLRDIGYSVTTATHAKEAIELISAQRFDVVFVDHYLGQDRGLELIRLMSGRFPDLSYILITGNGNAELAVEALKNGASDFITKPFLNADLIRSIEYVNRKRELERQEKELLTTLEQRVCEKTAELESVYFSVLASLAQTMEKRDTGTYGHSKRVSYNARLIAAALDLGAEDRENLKAAALLHDIGKIGTSDMILGKKGPLTGEEMEIVRHHPVRGVEILKPLARAFRQLDSILPAILHHHENFDGTGYPSGLAGDAIPLLARIIAVADAFDAVISTRPYRPGTDRGTAIDELVRCSGTQFDPHIVQAFVQAEEAGSRIIGRGAGLKPAAPEFPSRPAASAS